MRRLFFSTLLLAACASASAQEEQGARRDLACAATHEIACVGGACSSEAGESIHVNLSVVTASGRGNLCTYTYCRDFMLTPAPGDTVAEAARRWTGFTLSESAGSTEEYIGRPAIDYQLSISQDRTRFVLVNLDDGRVGGWAGTCRPNR